MEYLVKKFNLLLLIILTLSACGGGDNGTDDNTTNSNIIYDESVDGPLPYDLRWLSETEIEKFTFTLKEGVNIVKGTSTSRETFFIVLPNGFYLKTMNIDFYTHIDANDHIIAIDLFPGSQVLYNVYNLPEVGDYNYTITLPDSTINNGTYSVYSGTSVTGASNENPFSINFEVARLI